jgi:cystathionine beta-lyase/cystathionine gamma-synthase
VTKQGFATQAVHAGEGAERPDFRPVSTPIYPAVAYTYDSMADLDGVFANARPGYVYGRYGNPTVAALEQAVAALEGGEAAVASASGMAAIHLALLAAGLRAGDTVVAAQDIYGATYALMAKLFETLGVRARFVDATNLEATRTALAELRPRALLVETLSNPLLKVADLPALAGMAHEAGAELLVDATFTTPYLLQPLAHGADMVIHSATKYIGGHDDVLGGLLIADEAHVTKARDLQKLVGGNLGPFEAWLALRGIKTLPLRMRQQCENAATVAQWLAGRPGVGRVNYPGLPSHAQHELTQRLFRPGMFGAMISFELAGGGKAEVLRFMEALRLCLPATTLGDVYSLVLYPAMSSHRAVPAEERARIGIGDGLVRLSVGIEDAVDIVADLDQALRAGGAA